MRLAAILVAVLMLTVRGGTSAQVTAGKLVVHWGKQYAAGSES